MGCWCSAHPGGPRKPWHRGKAPLRSQPLPGAAPDPSLLAPKSRRPRRVNGVIERRDWSLPQASCSVTELLRHHQRHTFSASPRDFPLREHLSNPTLFSAATIRLPNVSPDLTFLIDGEISRDRRITGFTSNVSCASRRRHQPADRICLNRRSPPPTSLPPSRGSTTGFSCSCPTRLTTVSAKSALRRDLRTSRRQHNQYGRDGWGDHYRDCRARCRRRCRMGLLQQAAS